MTGQRIGYIRVSSLDQQVARQWEGIAVDRTFTDTASGKDTKRPQLELLLGRPHAQHGRVRDGPWGAGRSMAWQKQLHRAY
jgi:predicted site-specific integrase-resolvase